MRYSNPHAGDQSRTKGPSKNLLGLSSCSIAIGVIATDLHQLRLTAGPRKYSDGDAFELGRDPKEHLASAFTCLGASLARLKGCVALEELFAGIRNTRSAPDG